LRSLKSAWSGLLLLLAVAPSANPQFPPAPGTGTGLAETVEAIDSAGVTTRILYITAHPDDESAAVLTYLARGLHADVALLSLTRGEGGQNALGPEQAPQLGLIRTQELLAATRGYGVRLYFTRARDFGFSKTPEETEKIWGDQVTQDMVRIIRTFRPNIVINHWGGVHTGHGHHQASGILTPKAIALAADPTYMSSFASASGDQLTWKVGVVLDLDRSENPKGYVLPLDEISPLWGKSWREIGLDAFVNHHTQGIAGFLNSPFLRRPIGLVPENGAGFQAPQLAEPITTLFPGCKAFEAAQKSLGLARESVLKEDYLTATHQLADAAGDFHDGIGKCSYAVSNDPGQRRFLDDIERTHKSIEKALALAAGLQITAEADTGLIVASEVFHVNASARCRPEAACAFGPLTLLVAGARRITPQEHGKGEGQEFSLNVIPSEASASEPLQLPEPPPLITAEQPVTIAGYKMTGEQPVTYIESTSTSVFRAPLKVVPAYTIAVDPRQAIEVLNAAHQQFNIFLRVHSYSSKPAKVTVGLEVPDGLTTTPPVQLDFSGRGDQYAQFSVTPPDKLTAGNFWLNAYAIRDNERFSTSLEPLASVPTLLWSEPAQTVVHAFDINVPPNLHVGYISAEGEPIPDALRRLGIDVQLLDTVALTFGDLSKYDAIVVGVRAYELRPELTGANQRLLNYVSNGGTVVVQYNRDYVWDKLQPAPYPATIGNPTPRVTDETSRVKFLKPDDSLLNKPNKITEADFQGWVQERGLYFWSKFDSRYTPLLAMNDPGEKDLNGGLVYTRYGKGLYIYTGLAFFRELPEGVPGAYRLFVNLLSAK
jgi:LmbE family N-acetylglucosaminyl deacetylase